jgi:hypothetical protein
VTSKALHLSIAISVVTAGIVLTIGDLLADSNQHQQAIASRIAAALNTNPHVIVEVRANGDGTFTPSLDIEVVNQVVMEELGR